VDIETTDRLLTTTRAVRRRLDLSRPVERDVVLQCLRVAIQAPTAANIQSWRWLVADDPGIRAQLGAAYERHTMPIIERRYPRLVDPQTKRAYDGARYLAQAMARVPTIVIPCVQGRLSDPHVAPPSAFFGSIYPAIWSFQLALRSRGLGSVITTPFTESNEEEFTGIVGIPPTMTPVALLPVAYTLGEDFKPARRQPVEGVVHWNRWDQDDTSP